MTLTPCGLRLGRRLSVYECRAAGEISGECAPVAPLEAEYKAVEGWGTIARPLETARQRARRPRQRTGHDGAGLARFT